jgi:Fic family protein
MTERLPILLTRISRKKEQLDALRPLSPDLVRRLHAEMRILHTYNSNAIEGNTLTLSETKVVVLEGITIGGKSLVEHLEAANNAQGFDLMDIMATAEVPINHIAVQQLHEAVTRGILDSAGRYRTKNVRITGSVRSPPDWHNVVREMDALFLSITSPGRTVPETAAYLHHRFVAIHPFLDGNGRVARLLMNLYLIRYGYPPVIVQKEDRQLYYDALRQADEGNDKPFTFFIARAVSDALSRTLAVAGGQDELISLRDLSVLSPYSQEYLSLAARKGLLDATKTGGVWYSTKRALEQYCREHGRK